MRGCASSRLATDKEGELWNRYSHSETSLINVHVWNSRPLTSGKYLTVLSERSYGSSCNSMASLVHVCASTTSGTCMIRG